MRSRRLPQGLKKTKKRKMIKQILIIGLSLFVCFSQMSLAPLGKAYADTNSTGTTTNTSFIDAVKLVTGDAQSGTEVSTTNPLTQGETVNLEYRWSKKADQQLAANQPITFKIPDAFKVDQDITEKYISDNSSVKTEDGKTIGTIAVTTSDAAQNANTVTITFDDSQLQDLTTANGTIIIPVTYNASIIADGTKSIDFDLGNNQTTTVNVALKADTASSSSASSISSDTTSSNGSSSSSSTSSTSSSTTGSSADQTTVTSGDSSSTATGTSSNSALSTTSDSSATGTSGDSSTQLMSSSKLFKIPLIRSATVQNTKEITDLQPVSIVLVDPDTKDSQGNPVPYTEAHPASLDSSVRIEYTWSVPEEIRQTINNGDTLSLDLPNIFKIPSGQSLNGDLYDSVNKASFGSFTVNDAGHVVMTFNENFQKYNNVSFGMYVDAQIDKSNVKDTTQQNIQFPIYQQTENATIYFKPGFTDPIKKQFDSFDSNHNPKKITWKIDVNLNQQDLQNAQVIEDLPSEGLTYDSVQIYPLTANSVTGTIGSPDTSNPFTDFTVDSNTGTVNLGHITGAYELVYITTINSDKIPNDGGSVTLTNTATLQDGNTTLGSGFDQASPTYGSMIKKTYLGQDPNNSQVTQWQIQYNYGEKNVSADEDSITDTFDTSKFFYDNIKVQKVTWDSSGNPSYTVVTNSLPADAIKSTSTGFTVDFGGGSSAYLVTYDLKMKSGNAYIDQSTPVDNTATAGNGSSTEAISGAVDQQSLIKSHSNIDYNNKTVGWTLMVNEDGYPLNNWSINDTFSYPLSNLTNFHVWTVTKSVDSISGVVTWNKGTDVTSQFAFNQPDKNGKSGFQLSPSSTYNPTNETFMITYTTNFNGYTSSNDSGNIASVSNNSILDWYESQTATDVHETSTNDSFSPNSYTQTNGFKTDSGYNPVNQNILWKIYTNYNEEPLNGASISDPIPTGMVLDSGIPVNIYKYDINQDGSVANETLIAQYNVSSDGTVTKGTPSSSEFTVIPPSSGSNTLKVNYNVPVNDKGHYMVSFATDLRGQVVQKSYTNNATFNNGSYPARTLTDKVQPTNGGRWIGKYGSQDGKNFDWTMEVNRSLSVIDPGATITDTSSPGQIVNTDSFKVYPAKIQNGVVQTDSSGHMIPDTTKPLTKDVDYALTVQQPDDNGQQIFTLTFKKGMDNSTAYVVQYSSQINISTTTGSITNSASFNGNNSQVMQNTNNIEEFVTNLSSGGWAIGNLGSLTFKKIGVGSIPMQNVTFELWSVDSDGNQTLVRTGETDANGILTFGNVVLGKGNDYILKETSAPNGYLLHDPITIDTGNYQNGTTSSNPVLVSDQQNQLVVQKIVNPGDSAGGTEFELYKKNLAGGYDLVTSEGNNGIIPVDSSGKLTLSGLDQGSYYLTEYQPPKGYMQNPDQINFNVNSQNQIVDSDGNEVTEPIDFTDYQGSVTLTKQDESGNTIKEAGASFSLQKLNDGVDPKDASESDWTTQTGIDESKTTTSNNGQFTLGGLVPGTYRFQETVAPDGYLLNANPTVSFTISKTGSATDEKSVIATDSLNSVTLTKQEDQGQPILNSSATFQLINDKTSSPVTADDFYNGQLPEGSSEFITGSDGKVTVSGLNPGTYHFVETGAPSGYFLGSSAESRPFTISNTDTQGVSQSISDSLNSITVEKTDRVTGTGLPGAVFQLYDQNGPVADSDFYNDQLPGNSNKFTTGDEGALTVKGLVPGQYYFVEVAAPNGYALGTDVTTPTFGITSTTSHLDQILVQDDLNQVTLTKNDLNDKSAVLAGAQFKLENSLGIAVTSDINGHALSDVWTTNSDGQFTVKGLPTGSYQFVETKAPDGYLLDATPIPFEVINTLAAALPISATDKENTVTLTKVDKNDHNIHLQGAEFELQDSNGNPVTKDAAGDSLPTTWKTDSNGQFTVSGLAPGSYQFVETKAPTNYDLDATPIPFKITDTDISSQELTATDKLSPGTVQLTKVDKNDMSIHLQGATFKLVDSKGNAVTKDSDGNTLPTSWTTDSNGLFTVGNLAPGDYQFIETQAPYGYDLDAAPIPFTIAKSQQKAAEITATDKLTPGDVRLTKVDANDKNAVLKGAVFKLEDSSDNTLKTGLTTDNNGQFVVKGLAPGKYFFVETKAPTGYQLDNTPIPFTIEKGQAHAVEITAKDKPEPIVMKGKPGVVYNVVDNHGHIIRRGVMADEQGNVIIKGLKPGSYHLVRAVEAYVSSPSSKKTSGNLPTTGDTNDLVGMAVGLVLLLCGGGLAFFARRRGNN
ncbi:SpaA isopeptide-forming pilin-related protein [Sporolactobacillus spathodeae]|uniref:LPXTG-motif cell wall-anchored protein n=1 Tax=Sporolactobacillus spathodeae TaxID=1465502 RepID=A0ABS2Q550_9BACL|nr:SpaA isopeptide-forming pilin-related protein [Sporolactobacillus spathodeae]MBM7656912.1 LPXTG-motif cell wall-anchored protein [Sporolactobacillus spathodeae]